MLLAKPLDGEHLEKIEDWVVSFIVNYKLLFAEGLSSLLREGDHDSSFVRNSQKLFIRSMI